MGNRSMGMNCCLDCNKLLGRRGAIRCRPCENKHRHSNKQLEIIVKCASCSKQIKIRKYRLKYHRFFTCNKECLKLLMKKINTKYLEPNKCIDCGKYICRKRESIRCTSCANLKENNPNWQGGKSFELYPREFNNELKESIRKRDNYTCQNCNITEEEHIIVWGKILPIHHIDYNKMNCKEDNLITLCNSCNVRANYNRDYWKTLYFRKMEKINV